MKDCILKKYSNMKGKVESAEGLRNCSIMLMIARAGKREDYLLEGMACPIDYAQELVLFSMFQNLLSS